MSKKYTILSPAILLSFCSFILLGEWMKKQGKDFDINYKENDREFIAEYNVLIETGSKQVVNFFEGSYKDKYQVYIHPGRKSLDSTWQNDGKCPHLNPNAGWLPAALPIGLT